MNCPKCEKSYYMQGMSTVTAAHYAPIYKDGVNINPDRNIHTTRYTCLECGCEWEVASSLGEDVIRIIK